MNNLYNCKKQFSCVLTLQKEFSLVYLNIRFIEFSSCSQQWEMKIKSLFSSYRDWNSLRNWFSLIIVYNWLAVLKKTSEQTLLTCLVFVKYCWLSFWLFFIWTTNHLGMKGLAVLMYAIVDSKWPIAIDWITPGYIIIVFVHFIISIFFSDLFKLIGAWDCLIQQPMEYIGESFEYLGVRSSYVHFNFWSPIECSTSSNCA